MLNSHEIKNYVCLRNLFRAVMKQFEPKIFYWRNTIDTIFPDDLSGKNIVLFS